MRHPINRKGGKLVIATTSTVPGGGNSEDGDSVRVGVVRGRGDVDRLGVGPPPGVLRGAGVAGDRVPPPPVPVLPEPPEPPLELFELPDDVPPEPPPEPPAALCAAVSWPWWPMPVVGIRTNAASSARNVTSTATARARARRTVEEVRRAPADSWLGREGVARKQLLIRPG